MLYICSASMATHPQSRPRLVFADYPAQHAFCADPSLSLVHCRHETVLYHVRQRRACRSGSTLSRRLQLVPVSHGRLTCIGCMLRVSCQPQGRGVLTSGEGSLLVPCRRKRQETRGRSSHPKGRQVYITRVLVLGHQRLTRDPQCTSPCPKCYLSLYSTLFPC